MDSSESLMCLNIQAYILISVGSVTLGKMEF